MAFMTPERRKDDAADYLSPDTYVRQPEHDVDAQRPEYGQLVQTGTPRATPRKRRRFSASPQPPTNSRLRLSIKNTPKGKLALMKKVERHRALLQQSTDANSEDVRLLDPSTLTAYHTEGSSTDVSNSKKELSSAMETYHDVTDTLVHPIPQGSTKDVPSDFPNPNVVVYHPSYGWVWVPQSAVPMPFQGLNEPGLSYPHSGYPRVPAGRSDDRPQDELHSRPSSTAREAESLPLASPFQPKIGRPSTNIRQMSPVFEDEAPVSPRTGGAATSVPTAPSLSDFPDRPSSLLSDKEDENDALQDTNAGAIESSTKHSGRLQYPFTRTKTVIANDFAKLETLLSEIASTTGLTPDQIWAKWCITVSSRASDCRVQQFERYTAKLEALTEMASSDVAFETMICIVGRNIREDQDLSKTICSPMIPNFFRNRLNVPDEEIETQLKAYAYDLAARKSLPKIPSRQEHVAEPTQIFIAPDSQQSNQPETPTLEPDPDADETAISMRDREKVDAELNDSVQRAFSEPHEVKPMVESKVKKKTETEQRISELKEMLFELFRTCDIPRLSKPPLQFAKLPELLYEKGWVLENWPEEVPFPCDVKAGKGIAGLSVPEQEALLKSLRDPEFSLKIARKPENAAHPVIFGIPPSPTSQYTHGRLRILDSKDTNDRKGLPRRTHPTTLMAGQKRHQNANNHQKDRPERIESQFQQSETAETSGHVQGRPKKTSHVISSDTLPKTKGDASECGTSDGYHGEARVPVDGHGQAEELKQNPRDTVDISDRVSPIAEQSKDKARGTTLEPSCGARVPKSDGTRAAVAFSVNDNAMDAGQLFGWAPGNNIVQQLARRPPAVSSNTPFQVPGHPMTGPDYQTYLPSRPTPGQMYPVPFPSTQQLPFLPVQDHFPGMYYAQRSQDAAGPSQSKPPPFYGQFPADFSRG